MSTPAATITIELFTRDTPRLRMRGIDPLQAAQALATAAAQVILGQRQKAGEASEGNIIQVPGIIA